MTPEERLSEAVRVLAEHFDVVQIFAQLHDDEKDATDVWIDGRGNTLARRAHVESWLNTCTVTDHDDDDGEELTT
jgi:hypothetical protein